MPLIEGQQAEGRILAVVDALAVLAGEHGILAPDIAEVMAAAGEEELAGLLSGRGQGGPERADEVTGAILGEVDDFFVKAVENDERAFLPHEAQQIGGGDGAVGDAPGALDDAGKQFLNGGHRAGTVTDVIPQVDVDG